jgi:hypothetical protein
MQRTYPEYQDLATRRIRLPRSSDCIENSPSLSLKVSELPTGLVLTHYVLHHAQQQVCCLLTLHGLVCCLLTLSLLLAYSTRPCLLSNKFGTLPENKHPKYPRQEPYTPTTEIPPTFTPRTTHEPLQALPFGNISFICPPFPSHSQQLSSFHHVIMRHFDSPPPFLLPPFLLTVPNF